MKEESDETVDDYQHLKAFPKARFGKFLIFDVNNVDINKCSFNFRIFNKDKFW